jgi:hypothetical protein
MQCLEVSGAVRHMYIYVVRRQRFNIGARWGGWSTPRPGRFTPGKDLESIVWETECAPGPVWTVKKVSTPPGFDPRVVQRVAIQTTLFQPSTLSGRNTALTPPTPTVGAVPKQQHTGSLPCSCFILDRASSSTPVHCPEFSWRLHSVIGSGD